MVGVMGEYGGAAGDGGRGSWWFPFGRGEEKEEFGRTGRDIVNAMCNGGALTGLGVGSSVEVAR